MERVFLWWLSIFTLSLNDDNPFEWTLKIFRYDNDIEDDEKNENDATSTPRDRKFSGIH